MFFTQPSNVKLTRVSKPGHTRAVFYSHGYRFISKISIKTVCYNLCGKFQRNAAPRVFHVHIALPGGLSNQHLISFSQVTLSLLYFFGTKIATFKNWASLF